MHIRESHIRSGSFVARHFVHDSAPEGCGGESDKHQRCKSIAASKARQRWQTATVEIEACVPDNERIADILVTFPMDQKHQRLGDGIAIEVQHRNKSKDKDQTRTEYAEAGYSTLWLESEQFDEYDVDLVAGEMEPWWPVQVPEHPTPDSPTWSDADSVVEARFPAAWVANDSDLNDQLWAAWLQGNREHRRDNQVRSSSSVRGANPQSNERQPSGQARIHQSDAGVCEEGDHSLTYKDRVRFCSECGKSVQSLVGWHGHESIRFERRD